MNGTAQVNSKVMTGRTYKAALTFADNTMKHMYVRAESQAQAERAARNIAIAKDALVFEVPVTSRAPRGTFVVDAGLWAS